MSGTWQVDDTRNWTKVPFPYDKFAEMFSPTTEQEEGEQTWDNLTPKFKKFILDEITKRVKGNFRILRDRTNPSYQIYDYILFEDPADATFFMLSMGIK